MDTEKSEYRNLLRNKDYALNEDTIAKTFGKVYSEGEGEYLTTVYDTEILLNAE